MMIQKAAICFFVAFVCGTGRGQAPSASELLQKGIYLEETVGNVDEAIQIYRQVAENAAVSRVNAAQAEYRMAVCLQRKGRTAEAINIFQRLIKKYPEQLEIVVKARELLRAGSLPQGASAKPCQGLEDQVAEEPDDISLRERTIECYWGAQVKAGFHSEGGREPEKGRIEHVLWLIQHAPDREPASSNVAFSENYFRVRQAWMSQVQAHPQDARVLANAAASMDWRDMDTAQELASRAYGLDPKNIRAARVLAALYERQINRASGEQKDHLAQQALQLREQIWSSVDPTTNIFALSDLQYLAQDAFAAGAFKSAQKYAEDLARHDDPDAFHHGNVILGRLALRNGDVEEAKARLLKAGKLSGSAVLGSFGPNMSLARDLLLKGEQEVVLQYFDECETFWKMGAGQLDEWRHAVREGRIPNFGVSLNH